MDTLGEFSRRETIKNTSWKVNRERFKKNITLNNKGICLITGILMGIAD